MEDKIYKPKTYNLKKLYGISDETLAIHFKLYEGYVKAVNHLNEVLFEYNEKENIEEKEFVVFSEIKRRLGFEYNGMLLHEYYFGNLKTNGEKDAPSVSGFYKKVSATFGSYEIWKADFLKAGKMRGIGWAICYQDTLSDKISNHWITLHEEGNIAGFKPLLVMDMWEHAYLLDYKPSEKEKYIEAFFSNIDWGSVENRLDSMNK